MRRADRLLAAAAGLIAAVAVAAPPQLPRPSMPAVQLPDSVPAALRAAVERAQAGDCPGALQLMDGALAEAQGAERARVQLMRLPCLLDAGRAADAQAAQAELAKLLPDNALVRSYAVMIPATAGRFADAGRALEALATEQPAALSLISAAAWRGISEKLTEQKQAALRDRVSIALARADWQPADRPELREGVAQEAVRALLADRQSAEAGLLLARIDTPELLVQMATERAYAPLWPEIEARMGDAQAKTVDRFAAARLDAFARADDPRARRDAVRAFLLLGRLDDAAELAAPVTIAEGMDDDDALTVRFHAQALAAEGKRAEGIARLQPFAALDLARTPAAAAGVVTLAEMLDEAERPQEALAAAQAGLAKGQAALSPWGTAWLKRTEVCALSTLGRPEAKAKADALAAAAADNEAATVEALLCAKRADEAAGVAVRTLATADGAARLIDQFQPGGSLYADAPSRLRALWQPLLARGDVKAAFDKAGRILPRRYWPAEAPRPIPRPAGSTGAPTT